MKKLLTAKYLSLLMLLSLLGGKVEANRNYDDGYASESRDCCASSCYECGCNPLYCGAWDLQVQGGVDPILWRNRAGLLGVNTIGGLVSLFDTTPRFSKLFKVPWVVGGQVGYAWSDNTRVYLEFNYVQAKAKSDVVINTDFTPAIPFVFGLNKYKLFDGYVGVRYYWDRWCDRLSFFLGGKVGFTHHKALNSSFSFSTTVPTTPSIAASPAYLRNTVVAGGANVGLDVCFCGNWSLVITGEVVASCGPRATSLAVGSTVPVVGGVFTNLLFGGIGTELRFPVTAGIRYSF